jgi:IclR family transcriptional regulator, acetate operon repressor
MTSARQQEASTLQQFPTGGQPGTQTLIRGLRVLEAMAGSDQPVGVGELSRQVDLAKSTVQRLLRTLQQEGWAETSKEPITRWQLSPRLLALARRSAPSRTLREVALPHLTALGERSGETIHFSVPDGDARLVLIERVDSVHPVRTFNPIGASTAYHTSASGKAFMAALPDQEVEAMLARPLDKAMPNTVVDPKQLLHQVLEARERGYAVNISENRAHVCAIGSAVTDPSGRPIATVAISMPDIRFAPARIPEWGAWVRETAGVISQSLAE